MYKVGSFIFDIQGCHFDIPENMKKFEIEYNGDCYVYEFYVVDKIHIVDEHVDINKSNIKIIFNKNLEKRYLNIIGDSRIYAECEEIDELHSIIKVNKEFISMMTIDPMFVSLLSLERRVYSYHEYILHSAYMIVDNEAILFTAPSGTGKSTQASLWEKYRGARIINGDRSLIMKKDDQFYATGWPVCGSSEICFNETYPIKAIVILDQGNEDVISQLSYVNKTKKMMREITINYHNNTFFNEALNFIDEIINNVPIYHFICTISEEAVNCLDNELKKLH